MSFSYPAFLFGLFALAIPILIHLFNFRKYKKVYFTNVKLIQELKQESQSKSKLKHYLILLSRLFAVTCLVFAFAQPFVSSSGSNIRTGKKVVSVYIDNSFSMEAVSKNGILLETAKNKAREIAKAFSDDTKFQLLTNDFEGRHQRLVSKEDFISLIDECKISPAFKSTTEVYARQKEALMSSNAIDRRLFIISDFQKNATNLKELKTDSLISVSLIPLNSTANGNVFIDSCWFETPVQQEGMMQKLHVKLVNKSDNIIENGVLRLFINEKLISPASYKLDKNSSSEVLLSFLLKGSGIQNGYVAIDDHPVTFDDKMFFSFEIHKNIPTILITGEKSNSSVYFSTLMNNDSLFSLSEMKEKSIDFSKFSSAEFIVLNEVENISSGLASELQKFVTKGGNLFIVPANYSDLQSYNMFFNANGISPFNGMDTLDTKAENLNYNQDFFEGVFDKQPVNIDLPKVYNYYSTNITKANEDILIKLLNGKPLLKVSDFNISKVFILTSPLNETSTNMAKHAIFVPLVIRMALTSAPKVSIYYKCSGNEMISLSLPQDKSESIYHLINEKTKTDFIPEVKKQMGRINLYTRENIKLAGNYFIKSSENNLGGVAFNFERKESDLTVYTLGELQKLLEEKNDKSIRIINSTEKSIASLISEQNSGKKLWKLFVILTLVFLLSETLLIRFFK